ncbi:MAG: CinA family protein [Rhizobiaceae bacterium]
MEIDSELPVMAKILLDRFRDEKMRLATAESCTGGLVSALLTSVPGSSDVFDRAFITYSNDAKREMLGVSSKNLVEFGAVSAQVAAEMARGAVEYSSANAAAAITGVAGPGGGTDEKPVGLVFIAIARRSDEGSFVEEFRFPDLSRDDVRNESAKMAMEMLLAYAIDDEENQ